MAAADGVETLTVSWTEAAFASSHRLRYREGARSWKTVSEVTSPYTIEDLPNTAHDVQVGAVFPSGTQWSATVTVTPRSSALMGTLGVGKRIISTIPQVFTYFGLTTRDGTTVGSLSPAAYTYTNGTEYTVTDLYEHREGNKVYLETTPNLPSTTTDLVISIGGGCEQEDLPLGAWTCPGKGARSIGGRATTRVCNSPENTNVPFTIKVSPMPLKSSLTVAQFSGILSRGFWRQSGGTTVGALSPDSFTYEGATYHNQSPGRKLSGRQRSEPSALIQDDAGDYRSAPERFDPWSWMTRPIRDRT